MLSKEEFKKLVREEMECLDIVYETYDSPDCTEIIGTTGGDPRRIRVYKDGTVCEK